VTGFLFLQIAVSHFSQYSLPSSQPVANFATRSDRLFRSSELPLLSLPSLCKGLVLESSSPQASSLPTLASYAYPISIPSSLDQHSPLSLPDFPTSLLSLPANRTAQARSATKPKLDRDSNDPSRPAPHVTSQFGMPPLLVPLVSFVVVISHDRYARYPPVSDVGPLVLLSLPLSLPLPHVPLCCSPLVSLVSSLSLVFPMTRFSCT